MLSTTAIDITSYFRSRNVYLRITDGKKYCYYSLYAWSSTLGIGILAVTAHFMMDYPNVAQLKYDHEQEAIGKKQILIRWKIFK